jgi:hypothetical protein
MPEDDAESVVETEDDARIIGTVTQVDDEESVVAVRELALQ